MSVIEGPLLVSALINAPLVAIQPNTPDALLHAVTIDNLAAIADEWGTGNAVLSTACGIAGVKLVPLRGTADPIPWPPNARGPIGRCRECWVATGKKRPRSKFSASKPNTNEGN